MVRQSRTLPLVATALALAAVMITLLITKNPFYWDDGLRHLAMGRYIHEHGWNGNTGWNLFFYKGYFSTHVVDPWFLADMAYVPFATLSNEIAVRGAVLAGIVLVLAAFWLFLHGRTLSGAQKALLIALLVMGDPLFYQRLFLARPFVITTAIVILTLRYILKKKPLPMFAIMAVATLVSHLFVMPLFLMGWGCIWLWTLREKHKAIIMAVAAMGGTALGILLHPQSVEYVKYLVVFLQIPFQKQLDLGNELNAGFGVSAHAQAILGITLVLLIVRATQPKPPAFAALHRQGVSLLLGMTVLFLGLCSLWARAIDLLWPIAIMTLAVAMEHTQVRLPKKLSMAYKSKTFFAYTPTLVITVAVILMCSANAFAVGSLFVRYDDSKDLAQLDSLQTVREGARVLNAGWDKMPPMLLLRPDLTFATGMDPTFTFIKDPDVHKLLMISRGPAFKTVTPIVNADAWLEQVFDEYDADYFVVTKERYEQFLPALKEASRLREVSESGSYLTVFEVLER